MRFNFSTLDIPRVRVRAVEFLYLYVYRTGQPFLNQKYAIVYNLFQRTVIETTKNNGFHLSLNDFSFQKKMAERKK